LLRIDRAAVTADARLDGGYKQLLEVERAWRDMKTTLDLRPVYTAERIASGPTSCSAGWPCS
jgi:hypothetical protein